MKKIVIKKFSKVQKANNKGLYFLAAVFHLLKLQILLIYSKKYNVSFANKDLFYFISLRFVVQRFTPSVLTQKKTFF